MITSSDKKQQLLAEKSAGKEDLERRLELAENAFKEEQKKTADYLNRLKYLQADFENYKKRAKREMEEIADYGNEDLILEFLVVVDELELAIQNSEESKVPEGLVDGLKMILKNIHRILEHQGVTKIEAVGEPFDPTKHEALSKVAVEGHEEGTIVEEIRKGYTYKGKVIRPSIVKVATAKTPPINDSE
jgi:molecular chaperone GrpE